MASAGPNSPLSFFACEKVHKRSAAADEAVCHIRRGGKLSISSFSIIYRL